MAPVLFPLPAVFTVVPPVILVVVLVGSGIAKLRTPDDVAGWATLGVPARLRKPGMIRLHPWAEVALAAALLLLGGWLGLLAALAAVVLFAAYLAMVWRAKRRTPDATCACFGERRPITGRTIARNAWFLLLALFTAGSIGSTPLWGGVVRILVVMAPLIWGLGPWILSLVAVIVTVLLMQNGSGSALADPDPVVAGGADSDLDDYLRTRTPAVPVQLGDGSTVVLRDLTAREPILILAVSETCTPCGVVIDSLDAYRQRLPEVSVRLLLHNRPEDSRLRSIEEPQTLHDPHRYLGRSLADQWPTPSAVLLGADGMLAGGPVSGSDRIAEFVEDIYRSLHQELPAEA